MLLNQLIELIYQVIAEGTPSLCCPGSPISWEMLWPQLQERPGLCGQGVELARFEGPSKDLARPCFVSTKSSDGIKTFPQNPLVGPRQRSQVEKSSAGKFLPKPSHLFLGSGSGCRARSWQGCAICHILWHDGNRDVVEQLLPQIYKIHITPGRILATCQWILGKRLE